MGSPRKNGNTAKLLKPFIEELGNQKIHYDLTWLYDKHIEPCHACRICQKNKTALGCKHNDDGEEIFRQILASEVIVLATPIYSWYCTAPMKLLLDRLVYVMNKYYGEGEHRSLWTGKKLALLITCGYPPEKGADLFDAGMQRYCKHSGLTYAGMLVERDLGYDEEFISEAKIERARIFAQKLIK